MLRVSGPKLLVVQTTPPAVPHGLLDFPLLNLDSELGSECQSRVEFSVVGRAAGFGPNHGQQVRTDPRNLDLIGDSGWRCLES